MGPLAPLTGQSAQLRSTETCREVAADHEAPKPDQRSGESCESTRRRLTGVSLLQALAATPGSRGESFQDATRTTVHDRREAERSRDRRKVQTAVCVGGVPGDAHKRTRHGTAETTTMPRRQLPSSGRSKCLAHAGMDEKHNTESFYTRLFTSVPRTRRPGTKTKSSQR